MPPKINLEKKKAGRPPKNTEPTAKPAPKKASSAKQVSKKASKPQKHIKILRDNLQGISDNSIKRLARQAGIPRISKLVYSETRGILYQKLDDILKNAINLMEFQRKKTLDSKTVCSVLPYNMYTSTPIYKVFSNKKKSQKKEGSTRKSSKGTAAAREVVHFQKQHGTLLIRKSPFARLIKEVSQNYKTDMRFSKSAKSFLQVYIEMSLVDMFKTASLCMLHARRTTLESKDVFFAHRTMPDASFENHMHPGPLHNLQTYIYKVLKQLHPNTAISKDVKSQINGFLNYFGVTFANSANFFTSKRLNGKKSKSVLSSRLIQCITRHVLPGELSKHAVSEGTKAVTKYMSREPSFDANGKKIRSSRTARAGLQFSVSVAEKFLRDIGRKVSKGASVYLAGVMEYICAEIIELAGNAARDNKKTRINSRHLFLAVENDEELSKMFRNMNYKIVGGGVYPDGQIINFVKAKKNAKKNSTKRETSDSKKKAEKPKKKNTKK